MARNEQPEWLESFLAVAYYRSFSEASAAVHRSQSRVSAHVAALERSVGAVLFDRRHRPVRLTDAGEAYIPYARQAMSALGRGVEAIAELSQQIRGVVVVGAPPSASAGFLVGIIAQLAQTHPEVRIELTEGTRNALTDQLLSGLSDIAIHTNWPSQPEPSLTHEPQWREPFVAVMPQGHALMTVEEPISPERLAAYPLITIGRPGSQIDPEVEHVVASWGANLNMVLHTEQPQTLMNMVRAGLGIGIINMLATSVSDTTDLDVRRVGYEGEGRTVSMWWDTDRYSSTAARLVREIIRQTPVPEGTVEVRKENTDLD